MCHAQAPCHGINDTDQHVQPETAHQVPAFDGKVTPEAGGHGRPWRACACEAAARISAPLALPAGRGPCATRGLKHRPVVSKL